MKLIVGLGNPGIEYQFTPHNAGFLAIDRLAEGCGASVSNRRGRALTARTTLAGQDVLLAKPETFMNLSGLSVAALMKELELEPVTRPSQPRILVVLYDELAIPLGQLRIRERGSAGGHNGSQVDPRVARHRRMDARPHRRRQAAHADRARGLVHWAGRRHRLPALRPCAGCSCRSWTKCSTRPYARSR